MQCGDYKFGTLAENLPDAFADHRNRSPGRCGEAARSWMLTGLMNRAGAAGREALTAQQLNNTFFNGG